MSLKLKVWKKTKPIKIKHPILLITGDGLNVEEEIKTFYDWGIPHDTMSIGRSIKLVKNCDHWSNVDGSESKWWANWVKERWSEITLHTLGDCDDYDIWWEIEDCPLEYGDLMWYGSTSLFSCYIAFSMNYRKIVLAGCPLDSNGHWYFKGLDDNDGPNWPSLCFEAWRDFVKWHPESKNVRSFSGFTSELLGKPNKEFLNENNYTQERKVDCECQEKPAGDAGGQDHGKCKGYRSPGQSRSHGKSCCDEGGCCQNP